MRELKKFTAPPVMTLIGAICAADALYMLSLYQVTLEPNLFIKPFQPFIKPF